MTREGHEELQRRSNSEGATGSFSPCRFSRTTLKVDWATEDKSGSKIGRPSEEPSKPHPRRSEGSSFFLFLILPSRRACSDS